MPTRLVPPASDPPITDDGQHSQAWAAHFEATADALANVHLGVVDGGNAVAGQVGEYLTASASVPIGLASGVAANIAALPLAPGDWDISGNVHFSAASTTHPTECVAGVSTVSGAFGAEYEQIGMAFNIGANIAMGVAGPVRVNVSAATNAYLVARSSFSTSTMTATGTINARRPR